MAKVGVSVEVKGFDELIQKNRKLGKELATANRKVLNQEADHLQRVMVAKAPKGTGLLSQNIGKRIWKDKGGVTGIVVGVKGEVPKFKVGKGGKAYYPASQEYGWEYPKGVHHPPQPFVRPAFDENVGRMKNNIARAYKKILDKFTS